MREIMKSKKNRTGIIAVGLIIVMLFSLMWNQARAYASDGFYGPPDYADWCYWSNGAWVTNDWKQHTDGYWYHFDSSGWMQRGWLELSDGTYFLNPASSNGNHKSGTPEGAMVTGSHKINGTWYYFNGSNGGRMVKNDWAKEDSYYYYYDGNGKLVTGWKQVGSYWYYLNPTSGNQGYPLGAMVTGFFDVGSERFYFDGSGHMLYGMQSIGGKYYYFNPGAGQTGNDSSMSGGAMVTGWKEISGTYYYFTPSGSSKGVRVQSEWIEDCYLDSNGKMLKSTWFDWEGNRYYLGSNGVYYKGSHQIDGVWYYFDNDDDSSNGPKGSMKKNAWGENCYYGSDGKLVTNTWAPGKAGYYYCGANGVCREVAGWFQAADGYWYYTNASGVRQESQWIEDCYVGSDGKMATETWIDDSYVGTDGKCYRNAWVTWNGKEYYLDANGYCIKGKTALIDGNYYYFDANGAKQTGFFDENGCYYDENGVRVKNDWVKWDGYWYYMGEDYVYLTGFQKIDGKWYYLGTAGRMETGWVTLDGVTYFFDSSGVMQTGWYQDPSTGYWYYLNPEEGSSEGAMVTGKQNIGGTEYYFDSSGVLIDDSTRHHHLNPYYEYTDGPGGLYGTEDNPVTEAYRDAHMKVTKVYGDNVNKNIPIDYMGLVIGAKVADKVTVHIDPSVLSTTSAGSGWEDKEGGLSGFEWEWSESVSATGVPQVANVTEESARSKVASASGGNMYAIYENIGIVDGKKVNLKVSVVDYALLTDGGDGAYISFPTIYGKPGILVLNIAWIQLKYEIMDQNGNLIASTAANPLKGTTSYYDVDHRQVICFNDNTNKGVFARNGSGASDQCQLMTGTVSNFGSLNGTCVFDDGDYEYPETAEHRYRQGFTEIFEGNTLIRTFSFQHGENQGNGGIYHEGNVVENGAIQISKTIAAAATPAIGSGPSFTFEIALFSKDGSGNEVPAGLDATLETETTTGSGSAVKGLLDFESGKATVQLKHGQKIKILGLPSGVGYRVTEASNATYVAVATGATGTIVKDQTVSADYTNREKVDLTITKSVTGESHTPGQAFSFTAEFTVPGQAKRTETFTLTGQSGSNTKIFEDLPYGTVYKIIESDYSGAGFTTKVDGVSGNATAEKTLNSNQTVNFTNHAEPVTLNIQKLVSGNMGDKDKEFSFTVVLSHNNTPFKTETFTLSDQEQKSYTVPFGTSYEITENLEAGSGYTTGITGADHSSELVASGILNDFTTDENVTYVNVKNFVPPTGITRSNLPYVMMVVGAIVILALYQNVSRRRKTDDRA